MSFKRALTKYNTALKTIEKRFGIKLSNKHKSVGEFLKSKGYKSLAGMLKK